MTLDNWAYKKSFSYCERLLSVFSFDTSNMTLANLYTCTYPCQGGFGMECVNISSNDILQLGVLLLSYKEVLHDSRNKTTTSKTNSPHTYQKIKPD